MATPDEIRAAEIAAGLCVKRNNAVTAFLAGGALAFGAARFYGLGFAPFRFFAGALAGLLYANAFEYVLHRYLLHWGEGFLVRSHALHHDTSGTPDEARYVNFATSPFVVVLVFLLNAPPVVAVERLSHVGIAPGMFAGFTIYYVVYEEIHWRIHFGGWLPPLLRFARRHHMLHHGGHKGRYNVFLPIFDWIFERREWKRRTPHPDARPAERGQ